MAQQAIGESIAKSTTVETMASPSLTEHKKTSEISSNRVINAEKQSDQTITTTSIPQLPSQPAPELISLLKPLSALQLVRQVAKQRHSPQVVQQRQPIRVVYRYPSQTQLSQQLPIQLQSHHARPLGPQSHLPTPLGAQLHFPPQALWPQIQHISPGQQLIRAPLQPPLPGMPELLLPPATLHAQLPPKTQAPKKTKASPKTQAPKKTKASPKTQAPEKAKSAPETQLLEKTNPAPCHHKQQINEFLERDQKFLDIVNKLVPKEDDDFWKNPPDFSKQETFTAIGGLREEARVNALGPSTTSCKSDKKHVLSILPNAEVQADVLKELHEGNPNAKWWLKVGSIEVENNYALRYNGKDGFIGDEDLGDGAIQQAEEVYRERKKLIQGLGVGKRTSAASIKTDVSKLIKMLQEDNVFIKEEIQRTEAKHGVYRYEVLGNAKKAEHDDQVDLDVRWWTRMLTRNEDYLDKLTRALKQGKKARLSAVRTNLLEYNTSLTTKKRTLARYLVVFMISDEMQNTKPYSWPVRIVPVEYITSEIVVKLRQQLLEKNGGIEDEHSRLCERRVDQSLRCVFS
ncbi:uncharacterized protein [Amphiura filiformis]|uniref:uncharacterized protein n=1 Tax=Amphiura filiformis TaxID=82378 RepID=UPI003B222928